MANQPDENPFAQFDANPFAQFDSPAPPPPTYRQPVAQEEQGSFGGDLVASFGASANRLLEMGGDLFNLVTDSTDENWAQRQGSSGAQYWEQRKSLDLENAQKARAKAIEAGETELEKAGIAAWETITNPRLLATFTAEQLPMFAVPGGAGMAVGKTALKAGAAAGTAGALGTGAAVGTGAAMQSTDMATSAYDELMKLPEETWRLNGEYLSMINDNVDPQIAKSQIAQDIAQNVGVKSAGLSLISQLLPGARAFERAAGGSVKRLAGTVPGRALKGALGEATQEAIEEGGGAYLAGQGVAQVDPTRDPTEGVGEAAGLGALGGGLFGGVAGATSPAAEEQPDPVDDDLVDAELEAQQNELEAQQAEFAGEQAAAQEAVDDFVETEAQKAMDGAAAIGGDALDQQLAAQEVRLEGDTLTAQDLGISFPEQAPIDALDATAEELGMSIPEQAPIGAQDATAAELGMSIPEAQDYGDTTVPRQTFPRQVAEIDEEIQMAEATGDFNKSVRLRNAKKMYGTANRFMQEGDLKKAEAFRVRANRIVEEYMPVAQQMAEGTYRQPEPPGVDVTPVNTTGPMTTGLPAPAVEPAPGPALINQERPVVPAIESRTAEDGYVFVDGQEAPVAPQPTGYEAPTPRQVNREALEGQVAGRNTRLRERSNDEALEALNIQPEGAESLPLDSDPNPQNIPTVEKQGLSLRLASDRMRGLVQNLANDLAPGGDVSYTKDAFGTITGRTQSVNPTWFQESEDMASVPYVQRTVEKFLAGEKLGKRQMRVIEALADIAEENDGPQPPNAKTADQDEARQETESPVQPAVPLETTVDDEAVLRERQQEREAAAEEDAEAIRVADNRTRFENARAARALENTTITERVETEDGGTAEIEVNAATAIRRIEKRAGVVDSILECVLR